MHSRQKLLVIGSVNIDHIISVPYFPQPGETLLGSNYNIGYGGKGANQAVAAAKLGAQTDFIACVGDDAIGKEIKLSFLEYNMEIDGVTVVNGCKTGIAIIQLSENSENSIVIVAGANDSLNTELITKYKHKIISADYLLIQLETPLEAIKNAISIANSHHTRVVLNPAPARNLPDSLLSQLYMITPNETETELLTGIKVNDEKSAIRAANIFHQKGIEIVLITLGSKGVFYSANSCGRIIKGFRVEAVDTTAAGDIFNGALMVKLLEGEIMENAIRFAQAAAALTVMKLGAQQSIPTRKDIIAFLNK